MGREERLLWGLNHLTAPSLRVKLRPPDLKGASAESATASEPVIVYKTSKNARILFVGINPHPGSYRRGVPFSNNKMFWYLLNRAGLLQEIEEDLKDDHSLKSIYKDKLSSSYGLNFLNLVDRPTVDVTKLEKGEERAGIKRLRRVIRACKPKVVCFIGKVAFNTFRGSRTCDWGWQTDIEGARVFLMHFPIRGRASVRVNELMEVMRVSSELHQKQFANAPDRNTDHSPRPPIRCASPPCIMPEIDE